MAKSTFFKDFKDFISKGNILDMAVGVIIGGAFGKIVSSLVSDIITPLIGLALGGANFSELFVALDGNTYESLAAAQEAGAATLTYGAFIQAVIDFLIIALCIFVILRAIVKGKQKLEAAKKNAPEEAPAEEEAAEPAPTAEDLLAEIRDLLKDKKAE